MRLTLRTLALTAMVLIAVVSIATVTNNDPDLNHTASLKLVNRTLIQNCVGLTGGNASHLGGWLDGTRLCTENLPTGLEDKTATPLVDESVISAVDAGICDASSGSWPLVLCTQGRADKDYCKQGHVDLLNIPSVGHCRALIDLEGKRNVRINSLNGKAAIKLQLLEADDPEDDDGGVSDP